MGKRKLTDEVLHQLMVLVKINERFRNMEIEEPNRFYSWGEELQKRYLNEIEPVLRPFARYFPHIRSEMNKRQKIYERQISKKE